MLVGEQASVMLLSHETFAQFAKLPMADPTTHTLALYCFSVSARAQAVKMPPPRAVCTGRGHDHKTYFFLP